MHEIRFARRADLEAESFKVGDTRPEMILQNAHDGTRAYRIDAGLYRLVCRNGLVVADAAFAHVAIRHVDVSAERFAAAAQAVAENTPRVLEVIARWQAVQLTEDTRKDFARRALALRWDASQPVTRLMPANRLLEPVRYAATGRRICGRRSMSCKNTSCGVVSATPVIFPRKRTRFSPRTSCVTRPGPSPDSTKAISSTSSSGRWPRNSRATETLNRSGFRAAPIFIMSEHTHVFSVRDRPVGFVPGSFGGALVAVERGYFPVSSTGYRSLAGHFGLNGAADPAAISAEFLNALAVAQDDVRRAVLHRLRRVPAPTSDRLGNFIGVCIDVDAALVIISPHKTAVRSGAEKAARI